MLLGLELVAPELDDGAGEIAGGNIGHVLVLTAKPLERHQATFKRYQPTLTLLRAPLLIRPGDTDF
jgi:hypothetical protein